MPRNNDLNKILLIGSGPIVIGQGCEFDYSGVQACKALREERYQVVLVNSNPATIMTDPEFADRTYIEPITAEVIEAIMERSEEHTSELQSRRDLVCRLLLEKKKRKKRPTYRGSAPKHSNNHQNCRVE